MPITATYSPGAFTLSVTGTNVGESMTIERDVAGALLVNGGIVPITGGSATVANTDLIVASGGDGDDIIGLNEANGALPKAELSGGTGNDTLTGGSGADTLLGEAGDDILLGRGGIDALYGGADNDTLTGGDANDQMFGEAGNDRMIWNPGDDSDLMEGGDGTDAAEVNGGGGAEVFTVTANGTRVRFDRVDPAPFTLDIGTTETLVLNAGGGDDAISATGNLAALIALTLDGGTGNDTILGGNGIDTLLGGDGDDFVDGQQGNDLALLGSGNDTYQWDPGDGSDVIEGGGDSDRLLFNGSAANEIFAFAANGGRIMFTRNVGAIVMDLNDVERFTINALGGTDAINVGDLSGTDAAQIDIDLAATIGGSAGDAQADVVTLDGTAGANSITVTGAGTSVAVTGLAAPVSILNAEGANDSLVINGFGGADMIVATTLSAGIVRMTLDGGDNDDTILASQGADTILGGAGEDFVFGDNGNDVALLGTGNDVFEWNPGDGNDTIEGQGDVDELRFVGSNASETINIAANGGRILFQRDVASVIMDMDDVEQITFRAIGGTDTIVVGDLSGTDATSIAVQLAATGGGGDGAADTVTVNGTNGVDNVTVALVGGAVRVSGLSAAVSLFDAEFLNDRLTLNGQGGDDVIDASALAAGLLPLTVNGGLGNDLVLGSGGADVVNGGDGNDTAFLGGGDDTFVWNPGDDNDIIEGQGGLDTLQFNGANVAETITVSANGGRASFFRDVANVLMDLNDTEVIRFAALGGADTIIVNDLAGTDVTELFLDLASTLGGGSGDAQPDTVTLTGTGGANAIVLSGTAAALTVAGLPWTATLSQVETTDRLTIRAGEGNDSFSVAGIANGLFILTLDGGGGSDVIRSTGDGIYLGGTGDDLILAGLTSASELLDGGDGIDTLDTRTWGGTYDINMVTGVTNYSGESFLNFENLITGVGIDTITGTTGANVIRTNASNDIVSGGAGNDTVEGGAGGDTLDGGADVDTLDYSGSDAGVTVSLATNSASGGHAAGDTISNFENVTGSALVDNLTGNAGANTLNGGGGADVLAGLGGDDFYLVDDAADQVNETAGQGNDRIFASVSYALAAGVSVEKLTTTANGGTAAINLTGNEFANEVYGNAGANTIDGGGGADVMFGLGGNDWYFVGQAGDLIVEAAGEGSDRVFASLSYALAAGVSVEKLTTNSNGGTAAINLTGNELAQEIYGNAGNNILDGKAGADLLYGLQGNDWFLVDNAGDQVFETAGEGNDRIFASVSFVLTAGSSVEQLTTNANNGIAAINLTGNELANAIYGNAGSNVLDGRGGVDFLAGLLGNDFLHVDNAADQVYELAGEGNDRVLASVSYTLAAGVSAETLTTNANGGTTAINLTGNELANSVYGNAGANILDGKAGADFLAGLLGDDWLFVDNAADQVYEVAGEGSDRVFASVSYQLGTGMSVEQLTTTSNNGTTAIDLTGNELANAIYGNAGANVLNGRLGADFLAGLGGADTFAFTTALGGANVDTVFDFVSGVDKLALENAVFTGLGAGSLAAGAFVTGTAAGDADDRIVYNSTTGQLFFDADGTGATAAVLFATLTGNPVLAASDFTII